LRLLAIKTITAHTETSNTTAAKAIDCAPKLNWTPNIRSIKSNKPKKNEFSVESCIPKSSRRVSSVQNISDAHTESPRHYMVDDSQRKRLTKPKDTVSEDRCQ
jgi:hypothetical protein